MTLRLKMRQAARRAPVLLRDSTELVVRFIRSQLTDAGGFADRSGRSDLYYTVFGIDGLAALDAPVPLERIEPYLRGFTAGGAGPAGLDLVHLSCLARCWNCFPPDAIEPAIRSQIRSAIEGFRTADGGYGQSPRASAGSAYGCLLALGAYQDLGAEIPDPAGVARCLAALKSHDGAYANEPGRSVGLTAAAAAALTVLAELGQPPGPACPTVEWLLARCRRQGGFTAMPAAPMPDLLSTATALHALAATGADLHPIRERCIDFVDTLWSSRGGFFGHAADDVLDCEYTFYGLLALGHLSG